MTNLYHKDIYNFENPVNSYWESTTDSNDKYKTLDRDISANVVVIGGGYTGLSCALSLVKKYNEDVVLLEAGHIGWGSSGRNAGFCCIPPAKMSVKKMFNKYGKNETKKFFQNTIEGSNFTKNIIQEHNIDCDLTGDSNYEVAPHPSYFEGIKEEAETYNKEFGIDLNVINLITHQIATVFKSGVKLSIVVGGGNIFRGISASSLGMDRSSADYTGMMATVINSLILQNSLEQKGIPTRVLSAIKMDTVCEPYIRRRALRHIEKGRIVIFAAGTGNPFFTTDSAAALRASEMKCDYLLKATKVDGIYDSDPMINKKAKKLNLLSYDNVIRRNLNVMDTTSITLAKENKIPIIVFSILQKDFLTEIIKGKGSYTIIKD